MKPSLPKGTRDFTPDQVVKRNFIFETIRKTFVKYGYQPIETPVMESLSTLMGKYGEEGDRLIFKVLNNGDFLAEADERILNEKNSNKLVFQISKRGLRYDLTVPFARFVVMHQNEIAFPFKRYAIAPVWRADRPQKGRYQEFYQCDVDVVGSDSLMYEAELIALYDEVFTALGIPIVIKVNNRKILKGIAEIAGAGDQFVDFITTLDKLDKIGLDGVMNELKNRGFDQSNMEKIATLIAQPIFPVEEAVDHFQTLQNALKLSSSGLKGLEEIQSVIGYLIDSHQSTWSDSGNKLHLDMTLARGLGYYTGCIFEVVVDSEKCPEIKMGSIGGGGRYDDLTGIFGMPGVSGVGISFGAERIYDVMEELNRFPASNPEGLKLMLVAFDDTTHLHAFHLLCELRAAGIHADLYPKPAKLQKQLKYANDLKVPFVLFVGESETQNKAYTLKDMATGEQVNLNLKALIEKLK